jgi:hypothetical protein
MSSYLVLKQTVEGDGKCDNQKIKYQKEFCKRLDDSVQHNDIYAKPVKLLDEE